MRHVLWLLTLLTIAGCKSTIVPAVYPLSDASEAAAFPDFEGPAIARDYGNKMAL